MKKITISSLLIVGTLSLFIKYWMAPADMSINLAEEESYLYL